MSEEAKQIMAEGRCKRNPFHSTKESNLSLRKIFEKRWEKQGRGLYYFKRAWQKRGYFNAERFRDVMNYMGPVWKRAYK